MLSQSMLRLFVISLFLPIVGFGQLVVRGKVINQKTREAVPYANIGFTGEGVGTVSDDGGLFELEIPDKLLKKELTISHLNYTALRLKLEPGKKYYDVFLTPATHTLQEITVKGSSREQIGYQPDLGTTFGFFKVKGLGGEGGVIIHNEDTLKLINFYMNVVNNPFEKVTFRLNVYDVKANMPHDKLNASDIVFDIPGGYKGHYKVPLESAPIVVSEDFVVSVEVIGFTRPKSEKDVLYISAFQDKKVKAYRRTVSHCIWEKFNSAGLCFWLDVEK